MDYLTIVILAISAILIIPSGNYQFNYMPGYEVCNYVPFNETIDNFTFVAENVSERSDNALLGWTYLNTTVIHIQMEVPRPVPKLIVTCKHEIAHLTANTPSESYAEAMSDIPQFYNETCSKMISELESLNACHQVPLSLSIQKIN